MHQPPSPPPKKIEDVLKKYLVALLLQKGSFNSFHYVLPMRYWENIVLGENFEIEVGWV